MQKHCSVQIILSKESKLFLYHKTFRLNFFSIFKFSFLQLHPVTKLCFNTWNLETIFVWAVPVQQLLLCRICFACIKYSCVEREKDEKIKLGLDLSQLSRQFSS